MLNGAIKELIDADILTPEICLRIIRGDTIMKKNNGFTLIEIIVSLAITIAVLSSVLLIALNVTDVFNNASDMANLKTSVDKVSEYKRST